MVAFHNFMIYTKYVFPSPISFMPTLSSPRTASTTGIRIYRNGYGLNAESVFGNSLYSTMRTHSGRVVTGLKTIVDRKEGPTIGILICEPTGHSHVHHFQGSLTQKRLAAIHKEGIEMLVKRLASIYYPSDLAANSH